MNGSAHTKAAMPRAADQIHISRLSSLDSSLARLQRCITARIDTEGWLLFAFWSSRLSTSILDHIGKAAVAIKPTVSSSKHDSSHPPDPEEQAPKRVTLLKERSKASTGMIADARCFNRLWGTIEIILSLKKLIEIDESLGDAEESSPKQTHSFDLLVDFCQAVALLVYHICDHAIFFSKHKIIKLSSATTAILTRWSLRAFAINTVMAVVRVVAQRVRSRGAVDKNWKKSLVRTSAILIIAVNNALPKGPLNELTLSILGVLGSGILAQGIWEKHALALKA